MLGEQELIACLADAEDSIKRNDLLTLGGAEITKTGDERWANESLRTATIYIKLPHNSVSAQEKPIGFPTDAVSAPVQIQISFKQFSSVFLANAVTTAIGDVTATQAQVQATIPSGFSSAEVQFKQAHLNDRADSISARHDLSKHALSVPLKYFLQSQFSASLPAVTAGSQQPINLTGFRSGQVQGMWVWAVRNDDLASVGAKQPLRYLPLKDVELSVNGLVYYRARNNASQLIDLCERKTASQASSTALTWNATTNVYDAKGSAMYWTFIPFAQGVEVLRNDSMLSNGLGIANSVVNLVVNTGLDNTPCTLYASFAYNATLLCSGGSADYVF